MLVASLLTLGAVLDSSSLDTSTATAASTELVIGTAADWWWNSFSHPLHTVQVGTRLVFKFSASHDLWLMASQSAYDSCDFSGAVELHGASDGGATDTTDVNNGLTNLYRAVATGTGDLLFACEKGDHCSYGQKVKITVQTDPVTVPDSPSPPPPSPSPSPPPSSPSPPPAPELIVGGASLWNSFSHTAQTVEVGTRLVFKYSSGHNLWQMPSQSAYDSCDFSGANELAGKNHGGGTSGQEANLYQMMTITEGTLWFACEVPSHCNSGQKVAITVTAASNAGDTASASPPPPAESAAEAASPPPPDESSAASRSGVTASTLAATALAAAVLAVAARA